MASAHVNLGQWQLQAAPATRPQSWSPHRAPFHWRLMFLEPLLLSSLLSSLSSTSVSFKLLQNKTKQSKQTNKKSQNKEQHPPHISTLEICWHFISLNVVRHLQVWSSGEEVLLVELHLTHFEFEEAETGTLLQIQHLYQRLLGTPPPPPGCDVYMVSPFFREQRGLALLPERGREVT